MSLLHAYIYISTELTLKYKSWKTKPSLIVTPWKCIYASEWLFLLLLCLDVIRRYVLVKFLGRKTSTQKTDFQTCTFKGWGGGVFWKLARNGTEIVIKWFQNKEQSLRVSECSEFKFCLNLGLVLSCTAAETSTGHIELL